jgi:hypothetical protein
MAAVFPAAAATVSVLVIETGLQEGLPAAEFSLLWENALMDSFFEGGHIVSNAPVMRLKGSAGTGFPEEARSELNNAQEGGADFLVVALLDYRGSRDGKVLKPAGISCRLFRVTPYRLLFEEAYAGEFSSAGLAAGALLPRING